MLVILGGRRRLYSLSFNPSMFLDQKYADAVWDRGSNRSFFLGAVIGTALFYSLGAVKSWWAVVLTFAAYGGGRGPVFEPQHTESGFSVSSASRAFEPSALSPVSSRAFAAAFEALVAIAQRSLALRQIPTYFPQRNRQFRRVVESHGERRFSISG
jgi:hypothetical protein